MIKKTILFSVLLSSLFAYYNFGVVGNTYPIDEPDAMIEMQKAYDKIDKNTLKKELLQEAQKALIGNIHLPYCKQDFQKQINLSNRVASNDIDIPEADIHIKAGTPLKSFYKGIKLKYFLINAASADEFNWLDMQNASSVIISEGDLNELKKYKEKYILNQTLQDAFGLKCTPSVFEIKDGDLIVYEYKLNRSEENTEERK